MIKASHVKFIYRSFLSVLSQSSGQETANNSQLLCCKTETLTPCTVEVDNKQCTLYYF